MVLQRSSSPGASNSTMALRYIIAVLVAMLLAEAEGLCEDSTGFTHLVNGSLQERPLKIGTINLDSYSATKNSNATIKGYHKQIVERYDVTLIVGITVANKLAYSSLLADIRADHSEMLSHASAVVGIATVGERYHFIYNETRLTLLNTSFHDPAKVFLRDPYLVVFQTADSALEKVGLVAVNMEVTAATTEINALSGIYDDVNRTYGIEDVIFLGDLKADCELDPKTLALKSNDTFKWLIGDDADTLASTTEDCAYDRIIIAGQDLKYAHVPGSPRVSGFEEFGIQEDQADEINDHFSVEVLLYGKIDAKALEAPAVYALEWPSGTAQDPNFLFSTDGRRLAVAADFDAERGSGLVTKESYLQGNLKRDVLCDEVEAALTELGIAYPNQFSRQALTVWKQYFSDRFMKSYLPGIERMCMIDIEYRLVSPYPYMMRVSAVALS